MIAYNIFKWIGSLFTDFLFAPFNWLRKGGLNWWSSNVITWVFIVILLALLAYWMRRSRHYLKQGKEDEA